MPRYSPLPSVSIDPRNEADLVQRSAQVVYEASNKALNDFSAGNPLAALLEGQAFAQGEFLYWANQLPDKILIEWIGPFLGAMRRLGTPATAQLTVTTVPRDTAVVVPAGSSFFTDSQKTGGQSFEFISYTDLVIPAGESEGKVSVFSKYVGSLYNAPSKSITNAANTSNVTLSVVNPKPAVGGSDVESFQQVQERFFTLIRRKNPVSETDWQDFFIDLYGVGTITSVQPNRSSKAAYSYETDYSLPNGQVSFFVLGANGLELTEEQLKVGQNAVNFSVPIENQGHLFPITLSQVQYDLTVEVNPNGSFGSNFKQSSLNFRNLLFSVLQPNSVFPATINPTVSDIDAAFYSGFSANTRFIDPHIVSSSAYNTPNSLAKEYATYTNVYEFSPADNLLSVNDLVKVDSPNPSFYPVLSDFTPYSTDKYDQTIYGNIVLKQIKYATTGYFELGDVVYYDGSLDNAQQGLHVVLENISLLNPSDIILAIQAGKLSSVKTYSPWSVGNYYQYSLNGIIDPEIIEYDYTSNEFVPATPTSVPLNNRPGALVWLVSQNFTLQPASNDITGAQASFKLGAPITTYELTPGNNYTAGTWVYTPQVGSGPNPAIDPNYYYVDILKGAVVKYAYVVSSFTYSPNLETISNYFDSLVGEGIINEVIVFDGNGGLPICKYKPRFDCGQYLEYRESSSSDPSYYMAALPFTPDSNQVQDLLDEGLVINLAPTPDLFAQFTSEVKSGYSGQIEKLSIVFGGSGYTNGTYYDVPLVGGYGTLATANVIVSGGVVSYVSVNDRGKDYRVSDSLTISNAFLGGAGVGLVLSVSSILADNQNPLTTPVRMFTFFKGDKTFFRNGSKIQSYTATSSVTPLFNFEVYYNNKIFVETSFSEVGSQSYEGSIPYYNPLYSDFAEDTLIDIDGRNYYRVMRAFTPPTTVTSWSGSQKTNSCRYEEFTGNLLRFVTKYVCEEPVLPQFGDETSSIKLGVAQITIIPKDTMMGNNKNQRIVYVWENTQSLVESPELSWYTGTSFQFSPPNYREGTLAL
jgi:hypothetical protein